MLTFIALILLISFLIYVIRLYNETKSLMVLRDESLANILIFKTKRRNLIGQLLRLVRSYNLYERDLLTSIAESFGIDVASGPRPSFVGRLSALHMHFPEVKAQESYQETIDNVAKIEDELQSIQERVNRITKSYNTLISIFPNNYIAPLFKFKTYEFISETNLIATDEELVKLVQ